MKKTHNWQLHITTMLTAFMLFLSTSVTAIRGQLVTAGNVKVEADGKTIGFYSSNTGFNEKIYPEESEDGTLMVLEYSGEEQRFLRHDVPGVS